MISTVPGCVPGFRTRVPTIATHVGMFPACVWTTPTRVPTFATRVGKIPTCVRNIRTQRKSGKKRHFPASGGVWGGKMTELTQ
jgi:hypothetical protein